MAGSIEVVIGPNGYGKTTYLNEKKQELISAGVDPADILFLPSEIKLLDEVKDTVDTSQTMEFLMGELLETPAYRAARATMFAELDNAILNNVGTLNAMLDDVLAINGSTRKGDFIAPNNKRTVKNPVSINQNDVKKKMGSGQRMQLLLQFASSSTKSYIFLDEPEKYSHPSLLNGTAKVINSLVAVGKTLFIATHSPKLVSMLKLDYRNILIINDSSHDPKTIDFDSVIAAAKKEVRGLGSLPTKVKRYYVSGTSLRKCLERRHNRAFIESLFSKHVYLCEGANDELFIAAALRQFGGYYDDYCVMKVWGKLNLPVFIQLYKSLNIPISVLFDIDNGAKTPHKEINSAIRTLASGSTIIEFDPNLEDALGYCPSHKKDDALAFIDYLESITIDSKYDPQ